MPDERYAFPHRDNASTLSNIKAEVELDSTPSWRSQRPAAA